MIYCIATIIIVALICATYLYKLRIEREHDQREASKDLYRLAKARAENDRLRKALDQAYDDWIADVSRRQKDMDNLVDILSKMEEKLNLLNMSPNENRSC